MFHICLVNRVHSWNHKGTWGLTFIAKNIEPPNSYCQIYSSFCFSFFFNHFIYLFYFLKFYFTFKHYNIVLVLPNIKMNPPPVYMCSPPWTLLPPLSPYHPSGSSQCTSPKHPVSCIKPGLATHFIYDIIRISMPFSHIISPSPSPTESKRLFYTSVSLFLWR